MYSMQSRCRSLFLLSRMIFGLCFVLLLSLAMTARGDDADGTTTTTDAPKTGPNLLNNGGFEGGISGWGYEEWINRPLPGLIDHADKLEGHSSFKMGLPGTPGGRWIAQEVQIEKPGLDYVFSIALKVTDVPAGSARVRIGVEGRGFLNYGDLVKIGGTQDWKTYKVPVTAKDILDSKKLTIFVYDDTMDQGTVGIDAVSFAVGTLAAGEATPAAIALGSKGAILTGDTSNPDFSAFPVGQPVELTFIADGLEASQAVTLKLSIVDEHEKSIATKDVPVQADANGHWQGKVDAPHDKLGFYRVYAKLSTGVQLHALGTRPAGFLTYIVVPDPAKRVDYGENDYFGMQGAWPGFVASSLGVRWTLDDSLFWSRTEPDHAGQFDDDAAKKFSDGPHPGDGKFNVNALSTLFAAPKWATKEGTLIYMTGTLTPEGEEAWANYCKAADKAFATKYPERKKHIFQITWEPIQPWGFKGTDADLVRIYEVAYKALHEVDPNVIVAGPCRGFWNEGSPLDTETERNVMIGLLKLGMGNYMDAYIAHPYYSITPEKYGMPKAIRAMKEVLRTYSGKDMPMYGSEQGWPTDEVVSKEVMQAQGLLRQNLITFGEGFGFNLAFTLYDYRMGGSKVGYGYCYNLIDSVPFGPSKMCPKPIAAGYAAQSMILEGCKSVGAIEWLGKDIWGYAFERDGQTILALWNYGDSPQDINVPTGTKQVQVYDWMGNAQTVDTAAGQLSLKQLGPEPVYVTGVSSTMWGAEATNVMQLAAKTLQSFPGRHVTITGRILVPADAVTAGALKVESTDASGIQPVSKPISLGSKEAVPFKFDVDVPAGLAPGSYPINMLLSDANGNTVTNTSLTLDVQAPFSVDMEPAWTADGNPALAVNVQDKQGFGGSGNLTISLKEYLPGAQHSANPNIDEVVSAGKMKDVANSSQPAAFKLDAKGTQRLIVPLPNTALIPTKQYQALAAVSTSAGATFSQTSPVDFLGAEHVAKPLTIDGDLSDWPKVASADLSGPDNVVRSPQFYPAGLTSHFRYAWDEQNLYIAAEVDDDVFFQGKNGADTWSQDCIQLAFNLDPQVPSDAPKAADRRTCEINVALTANGPEAYRAISSSSDKQPAGALTRDEFKIAVKKVDQGRLFYEMAIPWTTLGLNGQAFKSGDIIGVAAAVNEIHKGDQNDPTALGLFGGITPDKDPDKHGRLTLK